MMFSYKISELNTPNSITDLLHSPQCVICTPAWSSDTNLYHLVGVNQALLHGPVERCAVGDLTTIHMWSSISMGIYMYNSYWSILILKNQLLLHKYMHDLLLEHQAVAIFSYFLHKMFKQGISS